MTRINKACYERGCACYDDRVDDDAVEVILAQPKQEPVVFNTLASLKHKKTVGPIERAMLNTTPPQRTWVGLTDEDMADITSLPIGTCAMMLKVEAKLKEKNT